MAHEHPPFPVSRILGLGGVLQRLDGLLVGDAVPAIGAVGALFKAVGKPGGLVIEHVLLVQFSQCGGCPVGCRDITQRGRILKEPDGKLPVHLIFNGLKVGLQFGEHIIITLSRDLGDKLTEELVERGWQDGHLFITKRIPVDTLVLLERRGVIPHGGEDDGVLTGSVGAVAQLHDVIACRGLHAAGVAILDRQVDVVFAGSRDQPPVVGIRNVVTDAFFYVERLAAGLIARLELLNDAPVSVILLEIAAVKLVVHLYF